MLELIFQGFMEWAYGLVLECWEYFSSALLDIMSLDFAYLETHVPIINDLMQVLLAAGWALLIGNLVFQAVKSMLSGLGFEGEDPKLLFTRTFIFAFLLLASPQICRTGLDITSRIMSALEIPDAVNVTLVDESIFGSLTAAWLLVIICGLIIMFKVFRLILEIAERYVILAMLTITAPLAFAMGGSRNTSEIFTGWCPDVRLHVRPDGAQRGIFQNAPVCSLHHPQRPRRASLDGFDYDHCKSGEKVGRHCDPHWPQPSHYRRQSGRPFPRCAHLYGDTRHDLPGHKGGREVRWQQRQGRLPQHAARRQRRWAAKRRACGRQERPWRQRRRLFPSEQPADRLSGEQLPAGRCPAEYHAARRCGAGGPTAGRGKRAERRCRQRIQPGQSR